MTPLSPPQPSILLETTASLEAKKIRFKINRLKLPIGLEKTFGVIDHPGAALAVPITNDEKIVRN